MNEEQYARVKGALLLAHAMGATIVTGKWGLEISNTPSTIELYETIGVVLRGMRNIPTSSIERRWIAPDACLCPMAALLLCEQPEPTNTADYEWAASQLLDVRSSLIRAFTCGWDSRKDWMKAECAPSEMAAWYRAGERMRLEFLEIDAIDPVPLDAL